MDGYSSAAITHPVSVGRLVGAILDLVSERGVEGLTTQAVADRLGATSAAFIHRFPTMEAIWGAVMDWLEEQLGRIHMAAGCDASESPLLALSNAFLDHVRLILRHPALAKVMFADHLRRHFPRLHDRLAEIQNAHERRIVDLIERAKRRCEVPPSLPREDAAILLLCLIQGLTFQFAIAHRPMRLPREAARLFALYLRAIAELRAPGAPAPIPEATDGAIDV